MHRLKHPVKEKLYPLGDEAGTDRKIDSAVSETFERELIQKGARKFKAWLEKVEIK